MFTAVAGLVLAQSAFAQGNLLRGKVTDPDGAPLPGVTVLVKGTTQGKEYRGGKFLIHS